MQIKYKKDFDSVRAYHNGQLVGAFELTEVEEERFSFMRAYNLRVVSNYQRKGIGTELVRQAVEEFGDFKLPSLDHHSSSKNLDSDAYFTDDGRALFLHCLEEGIISENYFMTKVS